MKLDIMGMGWNASGNPTWQWELSHSSMHVVQSAGISQPEFDDCTPEGKSHENILMKYEMARN